MQAQQNVFEIAVKIGARWYIHTYEPWTDRRMNADYSAGVHQKYYKSKQENS